MVPDKYSLGDTGLLNNEAYGRANLGYLAFFFLLVIFLFLCTALCCYLMYSMSLQTAGALFVMILFGWFLDLAVFRNLVVLLVSYYHYRRAKKLGF